MLSTIPLVINKVLYEIYSVQFVAKHILLANYRIAFTIKIFSADDNYLLTPKTTVHDNWFCSIVQQVLGKYVTFVVIVFNLHLLIENNGLGMKRWAFQSTSFSVHYLLYLYALTLT